MQPVQNITILKADFLPVTPPTGKKDFHPVWLVLLMRYIFTIMIMLIRL
jgi:hypothetical protein